MLIAVAWGEVRTDSVGHRSKGAHSRCAVRMGCLSYVSVWLVRTSERAIGIARRTPEKSLKLSRDNAENMFVCVVRL